MRRAVVHDYFTQMGGAEKVAAALMGMFPDAALHATVALPECMPEALIGVPTSTSWMQSLPGMRRYYRFYFLPPLYLALLAFLVRLHDFRKIR